MNSNNHFKVAIIGAGPAGIGAAVTLAKRDIKPIALIERYKKIGGVPGKYQSSDDGVRTFFVWTRAKFVYGKEYVARLQTKLNKTEVQLFLETQVLEIKPEKKCVALVNPQNGKTELSADAFILACGSREKSLAERGWIAGSRSARVLFSRHLLDLQNGNKKPTFHNPNIIGSDLVAYAAAAKLKKGGSAASILFDRTSRPKSSFFERLYFRRWVDPEWKGSVDSIHLEGRGNLKVTALPHKDPILADSLFLCGDLIPNSELAILSGLDVELSSRRPITGSGNTLSAKGWFVAGNILGGFHGADWCYHNGVSVAKFVMKYLKYL